MTDFEKITIETEINAPVDKVWEYWSNPEHIKKWNQASDDWHTTHAENDLRTGGKFLSRMEAKDESVGFDFSGTYDEVIEHELIEYTMADQRKVKVIFKSYEDKAHIEQTFDAETENPVEMQRQGWQAILNSFKNYVENN